MSLREKSEAELFCEIKEAFQIFDRDNDGIITKEEEQTILRMFGINEKEEKKEKKDKKQKEGEEDDENADEEDPKNATANGEGEKVEDQKIETVEFNEFFDNIQRKLKDAIKDSEILEDIDTDKIVFVRELDHDLQMSKEHISGDLIKKIIKDAAPNGRNYVAYEDFVKMMLNKA